MGSDFYNWPASSGCDASLKWELPFLPDVIPLSNLSPSAKAMAYQ